VLGAAFAPRGGYGVPGTSAAAFTPAMTAAAAIAAIGALAALTIPCRRRDGTPYSGTACPRCRQAQQRSDDLAGADPKASAAVR
jgi:hypothetical protein